jgi:transposase
MVKRNSPKVAFTTKSEILGCIRPNVAGLDIGASSIFACVGVGNGMQEIREFPTFTEDLKSLVAWLEDHNTCSVAMESTGVYWIVIYDLLAESGIEVLLVNARHLKVVPGRKTDVKDCQWIQQLHSYGLLRGSFRPDDEGVTLRCYVRQRSRLFESAATQVQLMHKALTQMNLQLNLVIGDITGATGMRIIRAIVEGQRDPIKLAELRDYRCRKGEDEIARALAGNFRPELILTLAQSLQGYDFFHRQIMACEEELEKILLRKSQAEDLSLEIDQQSEPKRRRGAQKKTEFNHSPYHFDAAKALQKILGVDLTEIPGLEASTVVKIIGEIGTDMSCWDTVKHFTSWLGLCPGNKISGGKVLSSRTKKSANKAANALRLAANSLYRSKTALGAYFRRMRARLGAPKAITATAHKLARILYNMIKHRRSFMETGQDEYELRYKERVIANLKRRALDMGYELVPHEFSFEKLFGKDAKAQENPT